MRIFSVDTCPWICSGPCRISANICGRPDKCDRNVSLSTGFSNDDRTATNGFRVRSHIDSFGEDIGIAASVCPGIGRRPIHTDLKQGPGAYILKPYSTCFSEGSRKGKGG